MSTFLTTWLQDTARPRLRYRTYERYRELIELHILPTLGKIKLQKLAPQHLQKLFKRKIPLLSRLLSKLNRRKRP